MRIVLFYILLTYLSFASAWAQASVYKHDNKHPFITISPDSVHQAPTFSDKDFQLFSTAIVFKVGSAQIQENDPFFRLYNEEILPLVNSQHLQLRKLYIRGAASPEGPYANNVRLGKARSQALLKELQRNLQHQYLKVDQQVSSITEDYGYLCLLMEEAHDPDYPLVKRIFDDCGGDEPCCKKNLQAAQGGQLWKRLQQEYFPRLRTARLIMWFTEPDSAHAPALIIPPVQPSRPILFSRSRSESLSSLATLAPVPMPVAPLPIIPAPVTARRRVLAVRTNLLHDFFYMPRVGFVPSPNIQFEYYPAKGHLTYNIGMTWGTHRNYGNHKFFQVRDFQFELRRYFRGNATYTGFYLGAYVHGDVYGIGLNRDEGWEGEGGGLGLSGGYVLPLNRKGNFRMEFMLSAGFFLTRHDPYVYGNPITGTIDGDYYYNYLGTASQFKKRNHQFTWFGPTNIGIQLTYDIITKKKK